MHTRKSIAHLMDVMGVESSEVSVANFIFLLEELANSSLDPSSFEARCGGLINNPAAV